MITIRRAISVAAMIISLCAAMKPQQQVGQPLAERSAQRALPKSDDPLWLKLMECKIAYNNNNGIYSIAVTPEVAALAGQDVSVKGFVLPMDGSEHTRHFLVTRNTPVCFYCPPGEPNEVVEVVSKRPVEWKDSMVTVSGQMTLVNNGEKGIFFKIVATQVN